jgi:two-component system, cell cycle sensor histidine kinase and response regulator CckA
LTECEIQSPACPAVPAQTAAKRLELIARITRAVVGTTSITALASELAEQVRQAFASNGCVIRTREDDDLVLLGSAGVPQHELTPRLKVGWGISEKIMTERRALFIPDVRDDPATRPYVGKPTTSYQFTSYAGAPLLAEDNVIGMIGIYFREKQETLTHADLQHLQLVGNHIAVAVLNERMYQELKVQRDLLQSEIESRRRTEDALRHSQALYRLITENSQDMICVLDAEGNCIYASPSVSRVLGYPLEQFVGTNISTILHPDDAVNVLELASKVMAGGLATAMYRLRHSDGRFLWMEGQGGRMELDGEPYLLKVSRDVSERRLLEEQLSQAQKMESIGRLAGGIAHDFNNLLTAILGYTQLAHLEIAPESPIAPFLSNIEGAAQRAAGLTRQMLAFARRQTVDPQILNLNELVVSLDSLLRRLLGADVELVTLPEMMLGSVLADAHQLEQVIVNLAVNARDAMPDGGKLTLRTANATVLRPATLPHGEIASGEYVLLTVTDTGEGMTEEVKQRIFEPFFTTKEVGKGTGLGLATCYGIVKQSGGHIIVNSAPGQGTTFAVYLPRAYEEHAHVLVAADETRSLQGNETVLLVEDEPSVRAMAARSLRMAGYTVYEAEHGEEALRQIAGREHEISLLITDVIMPRMGGYQLAQRLTETQPSVKILFVSGYAQAAPPFGLTDGITTLQKPFSPSVLTRKVRELLDGAAAHV